MDEYVPAFRLSLARFSGYIPRYSEKGHLGKSDSAPTISRAPVLRLSKSQRRFPPSSPAKYNTIGNYITRTRLNSTRSLRQRVTFGLSPSSPPVKSSSIIWSRKAGSTNTRPYYFRAAMISRGLRPRSRRRPSRSQTRECATRRTLSRQAQQLRVYQGV